MANVKISALPSTSTTTLDDYFVKNNSGETTTNKVKVRNTIGLTNGSGTDSLKSAGFLSSTPATSTGFGSVAIGADSEANADYTTAVGYRAECFDNIRVRSTALGALNRVAQQSTAVGYDNTAVGAGSTALGYSNAVAGGEDIGIGYDNNVYGTGAIAIGRGNTASATNAVAIGQNGVADQVNSVSLNGRDTIFSGTTAMRGLDTTGNITDQVNISSGAASYNLNMTTASSHKVVITASTSISLTNLRFGGRYRIRFENTGTFNLSAVTGTMENGLSATIVYNGGSRNNLTHNSNDIWYLDVMDNTTVFVTQFANYA